MHLDTHMLCSHEKKNTRCMFLHCKQQKAGKNLKGKSYILFLSSTNLTRPQFESKVSTQSNDNSLSSKDMHHRAHWGILYLSTAPEERRGEREGGEKERRRGRRKGRQGRRDERGTERRGNGTEEDEGREEREEEEEGRRRREEEERGGREREGMRGRNYERGK